MNFIKDNWFKIFLAVIACFLVYWHTIRSAMIKKSCGRYALKYAQSHYETHDTVIKNTGLYDPKLFSTVYSNCMKQEGA